VGGRRTVRQDSINNVSILIIRNELYYVTFPTLLSRDLLHYAHLPEYNVDVSRNMFNKSCERIRLQQDDLVYRSRNLKRPYCSKQFEC
jgi:hypothetical protein